MVCKNSQNLVFMCILGIKYRFAHTFSCSEVGAEHFDLDYLETDYLRRHFFYAFNFNCQKIGNSHHLF